MKAMLAASQQRERLSRRRFIGALVADVRKHYDIALKRGVDDKLAARRGQHPRFTAFRVMIDRRQRWAYLSAVDIVLDIARYHLGWREFTPKKIEDAYEYFKKNNGLE